MMAADGTGDHDPAAAARGLLVALALAVPCWIAAYWLARWLIIVLR